MFVVAVYPGTVLPDSCFSVLVEEDIPVGVIADQTETISAFCYTRQIKVQGRYLLTFRDIFYLRIIHISGNAAVQIVDIRCEFIESAVFHGFGRIRFDFIDGIDSIDPVLIHEGIYFRIVLRVREHLIGGSRRRYFRFAAAAAQKNNRKDYTQKHEPN